MNNYLLAMEAMREMPGDGRSPLEGFNKREYMDSFERAYQSYLPAFDAIEQLYNSVAEPEEMVANMARTFAQAAREKADGCTKRERETVMMNLNMRLAVFIFPAILHYQGNSSRSLCDQITLCWKEAFPKSNVQAAEVEYIEKGFHRKFCYITTAVCETFGKPDDCYELTLLRDYRDGYLAGLPEGETLIRRYYDVAPTIVKHINARPDSGEVYRGIWEDYLQPCIRLIEQHRHEECEQLYEQMVGRLQEKYFFQ